MSSSNTLTINGAFKASGVSYNITIETPEAKELSKDTAKITELFKAVVCSHLGVDNIDKLTPKQILDAQITYNPDDGAKIDSTPYDNQKLRDVFHKTLKDSDYQGMKVANDPTVANAIEDMYELSTSSSVAGPVNTSASQSIGHSIGNAAYSLFSNVANIIGGFFGQSDESFVKKINESDNVKLIQELCDYLVKNKKPSDAAMKLYNQDILPYIHKQLKKQKVEAIPNNIASEFRKILSLIKPANQLNNLKKVDEVIKKLLKQNRQIFS